MSTRRRDGCREADKAAQCLAIWDAASEYFIRVRNGKAEKLKRAERAAATKTRPNERNENENARAHKFFNNQNADDDDESRWPRVECENVEMWKASMEIRVCGAAFAGCLVDLTKYAP